jgi:hypothetical protein
MRRRWEGSDPPAELVVFNGRQFSTAEAWMAAWEQFHRARQRWVAQRGLPESALPHWQVNGDCPFDPATI